MLAGTRPGWSSMPTVMRGRGSQGRNGLPEYQRGCLKLFLNAVSAKAGGGVTYIGPFLKHAARLRPDWLFVALLPARTIAEIQPVPNNVRLEATEIGFAPWWRRLWWDQISLRRLLREERPDALYSTANFGMVSCPIPQILLVRNALYFSASFNERFLGRYAFSDLASFLLRRRLIVRSVRSADVVMTPTAAMLDELRHYVEVSDDRALVNPYGQDPSGNPGAPVVGSMDSPVRLLYVSYYREHKNLTTLLKALRELGSSGRREYKLITTLNPEEGEAIAAITSAEDRALVNDPAIRPALEIRGPCSPTAALRLYEQCDLFVFPSMVESFGFPLVEAMARGLPIIASDTPVNREVCGEAAVYFPLFDFKELAAEIERVSGDLSLRVKLAKASAARVRAVFSWDTHVRRILDSASELNAGRRRRYSQKD